MGTPAVTPSLAKITNLRILEYLCDSLRVPVPRLGHEHCRAGGGQVGAIPAWIACMPSLQALLSIQWNDLGLSCWNAFHPGQAGWRPPSWKRWIHDILVLRIECITCEYEPSLVDAAFLGSFLRGLRGNYEGEWLIMRSYHPNHNVDRSLKLMRQGNFAKVENSSLNWLLEVSTLIRCIHWLWKLKRGPAS